MTRACLFRLGDLTITPRQTAEKLTVMGPFRVGQSVEFDHYSHTKN